MKGYQMKKILLLNLMLIICTMMVSCKKPSEENIKIRDDDNLQLIAHIINNYVIEADQQPTSNPKKDIDPNIYYFDYIEIIRAYQFVFENSLFDELTNSIGNAPYKVNIAYVTTYFIDPKDNEVKPMIVDLRVISIFGNNDKVYTILDDSSGYRDDYNYNIFSSHKKIGEHSVYKNDNLRGHLINVRETKDGLPSSISYIHSKEFITDADFVNRMEINTSDNFIISNESKIYDIYSNEVLDNFIKGDNK